MSVEFIGMLDTNGASESRQPRGPAIDKAYLAAIARAHEHAGFDRAAARSRFRGRSELDP